MAGAIQYLVPIDLTKNELQNAVVQNLAAAPSSPGTGQIYTDTSGTPVLKVYDGTAWRTIGYGTGSVTSVGLSLPSGELTVSGSPVTSSGTLAATWASQSAFAVFCRATGSGTPSFQSLAAGHIPNLPGSIITSGTVAASYLPTLDALTAPAADVSLNSHKITNLASGSASSDAATYGQLLSLVNGATWKSAVACLAHSNITLSGEQTIDGVTTSASRVLVMGQSTASQNGIYISSSGSWTRATDLATGASAAGASAFVEQGTSYADTQWNCTNALGADVVGTNGLTFVQFGGGTTYSADGSTLTLTGTTFSINTGYTGQTSIVTVGTIATGTWAGTAVAVAHGGTGATSASGARANLNAAGKYQATIGDGSTTLFTITQGTHGLASDSSIHVTLLDDTSGDVVYTRTSVNKSNGTVTIEFSTSNAPTLNQYRVVLMG